jgi:predicted O-methyltransferase YrrM
MRPSRFVSGLLVRVPARFGVEITRASDREARGGVYTGRPFLHLDAYAEETAFIPGMVTRASAEFLYALAVTQTVRGDVVEVGSWQGKSTAYLARAVRDSGNGNMFAIDHFRGNVGRESSYRVGRDDLADLPGRFRANIATMGLEDVVTLIAEPSDLARRQIEGTAVRLLFVDGDHTGDGVRRDIELFTPLVVSGGLVVFDDYDRSFPDLVREVNAWCDGAKVRLAFLRDNLLVVQVP